MKIWYMKIEIDFDNKVITLKDYNTSFGELVDKLIEMKIEDYKEYKITVDPIRTYYPYYPTYPITYPISPVYYGTMAIGGVNNPNNYV
jgi:hypothetical protein